MRQLPDRSIVFLRIKNKRYFNKQGSGKRSSALLLFLESKGGAHRKHLRKTQNLRQSCSVFVDVRKEPPSFQVNSDSSP